MNTSLYKAAIATVISFASLALPVTSHAVDTITPGSACQPWYGTDAGKITARSDGVFTGAIGTWVSCPIFRTDSAATAVNPLYVELFNGGGKVTCTLTSYEWNGGFKGGNTQSTAVSGVTWLTHFLPAAASSQFSHLNVYCFLPPNSGIRNIFTRR